MYTSSQVDLKVEGRKTEVKMPIQHSYCPWCGMKADDEVEEKSTEKINQVTG